jgi:AcrR family transcriptional regulator
MVMSSLPPTEPVGRSASRSTAKTSGGSTQEPSRRPGRPRGDDGEVAERLLTAATELAVEQGFDTCGLREIAARAEVSPGMIAYYFGDRQGLYEAMLQRVLDRISEKVAALIEDPTTDGDDRIDELLRLQVATIAADPWLPKLIIREVLAKTESSIKTELAGPAGQGPMKLMIRWIEEEQSRGVLRADLDPKMLALTVVSISAFPFMLLPLIGDEIGLALDDEFPERLIEHNQRLLARGIRALSEAP